ncbi:exonuclease SbcCD subunit D C-terminal domain-containing protein [Spirochaeta isovalerica]|uniref:Nuclease SbcCD subunit D n=1 Tax=Spirochaeta isovalerica TaxID=150 RepID=A0A841R8H2_9SPIO|nr:exonuclease SbcCD subunit D C-terminal domain-containing protein [Spirochaeta isovalerica]MBB6478772.1 exonuclease SbcD [Spirochaeta isovalerica]
MRILHTSDWHLGARLCDRERIDEHKAFLDWIIHKIETEKVNILIISGDIFDTSTPPNNAEALYYDFICKLNETDLTATVIIGGNHDSISKINSPKLLLSRLKVFVVGGAEKSPEDCLIPILENDRVHALVCAVPFLRERDIRIPVAGENWEERERGVAEGIHSYYRSVVESAEKDYDLSNIPLIGMGHLFVTGSLSGAGQRDLYVGNLGSISTEIFSDSFSYIALGHIHKPQQVGGKDYIRYSGSPLAMDFGEEGEKSVIIAEFKENKLTGTKTLTIPQYRKLIRFKGNLKEVEKQIDDFVPPDTPFWADAELLDGSALGDVSRILNEKAIEKGFEFLRIRILHEASQNIFKNRQSKEIKDLTPEEIFIERCRNAGLEEEKMNELMPLYKELLVRVENVLENDHEN